MDIYLSGILRSEQALRMGVLPSPYQQEFEIATGTQSLTVTFTGGDEDDNDDTKVEFYVKCGKNKKFKYY